MATAPVTLDLSKSQPIPNGVTLDLSKSQPLNNAASTQAAPQPSLIDRLTEIQKPDPNNRWSPSEALKAVGNVGAGAMTPILHPIDTLTSGVKLASEAYTYPWKKAMGQPTAIDSMVKGAADNPYGTVESGIGQAATMKGLSEIPPEAASAPIRGAAKSINAVKRNAPAIGAGAGLIGGATDLATKGSPYGLLYMPYVGERLGKFVQRAPDVPGERFGLPPESEPPPLPANEGGTVSRSSTIGASRTGAVPSPEQFIGNPTTTRPEAIPAPSKFAGGKFEPANEPMKGTPSGPPAGVGKYQPPERIPPPVRTAPIRPAPEPVAEKPPQVSMADQIATAKGLGFKNINEAINKFGFQGWQKLLGQNEPSPEPPSVQPGSPTPFHSDAPLTPADLMNSRMNTRIPTWEEVERQGQKERFYAEAPQVKTKNQLVNEVQPSMVAKSEANTSPYADNLPTKKIRR